MTSPNRLAQPLAALVAALALAACGGGGGSTPQPECRLASDCGTDTFCQRFTCVAGACGTAPVAAGSALPAQAPGDCREDRCDGHGGVTSAADPADLPPADPSGCTEGACAGGQPEQRPLPLDTACAGGVCNGIGLCVQCNAAAQCPGADTECQARTCDAGACGVAQALPGTVVSTQVGGDCQENQCDGHGAVVSVAQDADVPPDDGLQCTADTCSAGAPVHPPRPTDTACSQSGGVVCDGAGACVACNAAAQCPASAGECQVAACTAHACGFAPAPAGTVVAAQVAGDCQEVQCDGAGATVSVPQNGDLPPSDGNQCTVDVCQAGAPAHPPAPGGTACNQAGGAVCDGAGTCVGCTVAAQCPPPGLVCQVATCQVGQCGVTNAPAGTPCAADGVCDGAGNCGSVPFVNAVTPSGVSADVASFVQISFNAPMSQATLTVQTSVGACTGAIQLSADGFATCAAFSQGTAQLVSPAIALLVPAPGLLANRTYQLKVTTAARSSLGFALGAESSATFATVLAGCSTPATGAVVIEEVYGAGGNAGATFTNDYVVLRNRSAGSVSLAGWSLQYASAAGTTWSVAPLAGTIPAGGFYLVQLGTSGAVGAAPPAPDASAPGLNIASASGKVALLSSTTALPPASCPTSASLVDFVGYGTADCASGGAGSPAAPAPGATTSIQRGGGAGCVDTGSDSTDFLALSPLPRTTATSAGPCTCAAAPQNESNSPAEADFCNVQFPASIDVAVGTPVTVFGRIFQAGRTEAAGADPGIVAQAGYGLASQNPEYSTLWTWIPAAFSAQVGNDDEYAATFPAPAVVAGPVTRRFAYRFSIDGGTTWTVCDLDGAGRNAGLTFDLTQLPVLITR